ncbi:universal stress protein [Klenkia terrae]|jgi:nucleotide-binding universal stress UspA family protein|uniref:Universal stress protein n=1 Tax=Klenkia terrae TaxID=1052259 RepID=A0ABU8EDA9_9ACTN|nr:universal stress protein [Klenkia terrae]SSC25723.1 Universal stress protein A [Klenkia terrae]
MPDLTDVPSGPSNTSADPSSPPVVVGVDGSVDSRAALVHALGAAARRGGELRIVSTFSLQAMWWGGWPIALPLDRLRDDLEARVRQMLTEVRDDPAVASVAGADRVVTMLDVAVGPAVTRLVEASAGASLLVVGTHGRGVARDVLLGSVALQCVAHAHCPVQVVRAGTQVGRPGPVVVGVDGSEGSRAALVAALAEAARRGAEVVALAAFEMVDHWVDLSTVGAPGRDEVRWQVQRGVDDLVADALCEHQAVTVGPVPVVRTLVVEGPPAQVLVREATDLDAVLLVVGSRGRGELRGLLLGSIALACAARAPGPVLVVHPTSVRATDSAPIAAAAATG